MQTKLTTALAHTLALTIPLPSCEMETDKILCSLFEQACEQISTAICSNSPNVPAPERLGRLFARIQSDDCVKVALTSLREVYEKDYLYLYGDWVDLKMQQANVSAVTYAEQDPAVAELHDVTQAADLLNKIHTLLNTYGGDWVQKSSTLSTLQQLLGTAGHDDLKQEMLCQLYEYAHFLISGLADRIQHTDNYASALEGKLFPKASFLEHDIYDRLWPARKREWVLREKAFKDGSTKSENHPWHIQQSYKTYFDALKQIIAPLCEKRHMRLLSNFNYTPIPIGFVIPEDIANNIFDCCCHEFGLMDDDLDTRESFLSMFEQNAAVFHGKIRWLQKHPKRGKPEYTFSQLFVLYDFLQQKSTNRIEKTAFAQHFETGDGKPIDPTQLKDRGKSGDAKKLKQCLEDIFNP